MTFDITPELNKLFVELFDASELRRFLYAGPQGPEVTAELPGPVTTKAELAFEAALVLKRYGLIGDDLFIRICAERPNQVQRILIVWRRINPDARPPDTFRPSLPPPPPPPRVHRLKITVGQGEWQSDPTQLNSTYHCTYELSVDGRVGVGCFQCPWGEQELRSIRARLRASSVRPDTKELLSWGCALRDALVGLDKIMGGVPLSSATVEFEIQIYHASLLLLPWELLVPFVGPQPEFVVLSKNTALFRSIPRYVGSPPRSFHLGAPVIFAWSNAGGVVPHEEHRNALVSVLGAERLIEVPDASLKGIREAYHLASGLGAAPTALHLLCHGAPVGKSEYGLRLHGADGKHATVESHMLQTSLSTHLDGVSLLSLAACYGAEVEDWRSPVSSVAQAARAAGVDVVASQFLMSFDASVIMARQLYRSLFMERQPLVIAHHRTISVLNQDLPDTLDWASLVLMKAS